MPTSKSHIFEISSYSELSSIFDSLVYDNICKYQLPSVSLQDSPQVEIQQEQDYAKLKLLERHDYIELVLMVDSSGSIGYSDFLKFLQLCEGLVNSLANIYQEILLSLVTFSDEAFVHIYPSPLHSMEAFVAALRHIQYHPGKTNLANLFDVVYKEILKPGHLVRTNAAKIGVILTDGGSTDHPAMVRLKSALIKNFGIELLVVAFGTIDLGTLQRITPQPERILMYSEYHHFNDIITDIINTIKDGKFGNKLTLGEIHTDVLLLG